MWAWRHCHFSSNSEVSRLNNYKVLAKELLPPGRGVFGMDHRAIAWCHGILEQLRKVLWILAEHELGKENHWADEGNDVVRRRQKVEKILQVGRGGGSHSFMEDVRKMNTKFYVSFCAGMWAFSSWFLRAVIKRIFCLNLF